MDKPDYFVSDVHLRPLSAPGERRKQERLRGFLDHLVGRARHLYVVGDLFDFWFEYRHAVPKGHFRVLRAFADLIAAGVPATYPVSYTHLTLPTN